MDLALAAILQIATIVMSGSGTCVLPLIDGRTGGGPPGAPPTTFSIWAILAGTAFHATPGSARVHLAGSLITSGMR